MSTPPDRGSGPAATDPAAAPQLATLASVADQVAAIDRLVGLARGWIRVFDGDLSQMGWNTAARSERLSAFLRGSRHAKLDVIVHDTRWLEGSCPRLVALLRQHAQAITIYRTAADPLVLVDDRHFLHRFHLDQPRAALGIDAPQDARPLVNRFEEIWATGEPGPTATTLGL
jgi:hypothetical protein